MKIPRIHMALLLCVALVSGSCTQETTPEMPSSPKIGTLSDTSTTNTLEEVPAVQRGDMHQISSSWMKYVNDAALLRNLTIVGTHDAGASVATGSWASLRPSKTQYGSISEQLNSGVRYLDIRIDWWPGYNKFYVYHGTIYQHKELEADVLRPIQNFLVTNPTETVFVTFKKENDGDRDEWARELQRTLAQYKEIIAPNWGSSTTIGEVRGKMLAITRDIEVEGAAFLTGIGNNKVTPSAFLYTPQAERTYQRSAIYYTDDYKSSQSVKIENLKQAIELSNVPSSGGLQLSEHWFITGANLAGLNPYGYASTVNDALQQILSQKVSTGIQQTQIPQRIGGILLIDYALDTPGLKILDIAMYHTLLVHNIAYREREVTLRR